VRFSVRHETTYRYDAPVALGEHVLRLTPRPEGVSIVSHDIVVDPAPATRRDETDGFGNPLTRLRFAGTTRSLGVESRFVLDTLPPPSLDVPLPPLPWTVADTPAPDGVHASVRAFAEALAREAEYGAVAFLDRLSETIHSRTTLDIRPTGNARAAHETLALREGACRDVTVLFVEACRALGLNARFVSGYQACGQSPDGRRHLHAWPEVQLPDLGWRGWDVTHGTRVTDGHVALCAAPSQAATMPIEGGYSFSGDAVHSTLDYALSIDAA
jgi:transglutaminase-like putative cysteine protease